MSSHPNKKELERRVRVLNRLIDTYGLARVSHAGMVSSEGVRQCASKTAPRSISAPSLQLMLYRLKDPKVAREWNGSHPQQA